MITIKHEQIKSMPILHIYKQNHAETPRPCVIFIHGFTSVKEQNLNYAYHLAEKGFRVILPDAPMHGERDGGGDVTYQFWDIVVQMVHEIDVLKHAFAARKLMNEKIGLAGTSMGGIVTLAAMTQYPWITAAVSLMGSPSIVSYAHLLLEEIKQRGMTIPFSAQELDEKITGLAQFDLSLQAEKLAQRPLLFWHGEKDPVVPAHFASQFYQAVSPIYKDQKEKLQFILDPQAEHQVSHSGMIAMIDWFDQYLNE